MDDLFQEKGPSNFVFSTAFFQLLYFPTQLNPFQTFWFNNILLKLGKIRFDYSHSIVSVNCVCTTVLFIFYETRLTTFLHSIFHFACCSTYLLKPETTWNNLERARNDLKWPITTWNELQQVRNNLKWSMLRYTRVVCQIDWHHYWESYQFYWTFWMIDFCST